MRDGNYIEIREYAKATPDGDEIVGPLRWYIAGWMPGFDIGNGLGVQMRDGAAIPFTYRRWCK